MERVCANRISTWVLSFSSAWWRRRCSSIEKGLYSFWLNWANPSLGSQDGKFINIIFKNSHAEFWQPYSAVREGPPSSPEVHLHGRVFLTSWYSRKFSLTVTMGSKRCVQQCNEGLPGPPGTSYFHFMNEILQVCRVMMSPNRLGLTISSVHVRSGGCWCHCVVPFPSALSLHPQELFSLPWTCMATNIIWQASSPRAITRWS